MEKARGKLDVDSTTLVVQILFCQECCLFFFWCLNSVGGVLSMNPVDGVMD